jgi:hypothetical protein
MERLGVATSVDAIRIAVEAGLKQKNKARQSPNCRAFSTDPMF